MNYITLVTDNVINRGSISINGDNLINVSEGDSEEITIDDLSIISEVSGDDSDRRPLHCSELFNKLKSRNWNNIGIKFISTRKDDNNAVKMSYSSSDRVANDGIPYIDTTNLNFGIKTGLSEVDIEEGISEVNDLYKKLYKDMNGIDETRLFRSGKNPIDILNGTTVINLINCDSDIYTNCVNLVELIRHASSKQLSAKVDLSIQYSKNNKVYTRDLVFKAFDNSNDKVNIYDFINEIERDVIIEYINGVVKVLPMSDNIDEFIISNCTVTYGNI